MNMELLVNGRVHLVDADPMARLLDVLRDTLELTGTREGCGEGGCGACTVLLDGEPVVSCLLPVGQCQGHEIETIESLAERRGPRRLMERLVAAGGVQCGACSPGMIVTASALLRGDPDCEPEKLRQALAGNLCRCTGYGGILRGLGPQQSQGEQP